MLCVCAAGLDRAEGQSQRTAMGPDVNTLHLRNVQIESFHFLKAQKTTLLKVFQLRAKLSVVADEK
jgi:hypothetical protein